MSVICLFCSKTYSSARVKAWDAKRRCCSDAGACGERSLLLAERVLASKKTKTSPWIDTRKLYESAPKLGDAS